MELSNMKRDSRQVEGGRWIDEIPGMGDLRLRVRGLSSPQVSSLRSRKLRRVTKDEKQSDGSVKMEVELRVFGEVLHEAVLLEWENLTDKGKDVPFDSDLARTYCTDPDYMPFADAVTWAANAVDRGTTAAKEDLEKNSREPSRSHSHTKKEAAPATT